MNGTSFRGRGCIPRGRKPRGLVTGIGGTHIPQPNFIQSNRESHVPPGNFWLDHSSSHSWQQMNGPPPPPQPLLLYSNFESHRYRGRPQFCTGIGIRGNIKKIRSEGKPRPGILPTPRFRGMGISRPPQPEQLRFPPPLGSEEERQQKIAETADKIKQKLSSLGIDNMVNFWEDDVRDVSFSQTEEHSVINKAIPELKHDLPELNLTVNDFKDIGRVNPDNTASLYDSVEVIVQKNSKPEVDEVKDNPDSDAWDDARHKNIRTDIKEPLKITEKLAASCKLTQSIECAEETLAKCRGSLKENCNEPTNDESDQIVLDSPNYDAVSERNISTSKLSSDLSSGQTEKDESKVNNIAAKTSDSKPEFNKVREKLREVIKIERQNEKEGTAGPRPDNRTTLFQHTTGPRLQPPVRLDFHPGIRPRVPRFQNAPHFRPPFRPEHGIEMRPNFRPDFPPRFNHGPKNFNISPRLRGPHIIPPEFNGRTLSPMVGPKPIVDHSELNMQLNFDPREPPPRFKTAIFNPNELPPKFCPPSGLNGFQSPSGFYQNGPPPRFINQDQKSGGLPPPFAPNLSTSSPVTDFSQLMPPSYNQIQQMHCPSYAPPINGGFNPAVPPPNPAPCIIPNFPPPSIPSSASSSSCSSPFTTEAQSIMQLPLIPMNALEIQPPPPPPPPPHPPPVPPRPPPSRHLDNKPKTKDERHFSQENGGTTPNMKDELEDMQEALEFAKQFMNMSNDKTENDTNNFNMPVFPDLIPIPSTQLYNVEQEPSTCESGNNDANKKTEVCKSGSEEAVKESNPCNVFVETITKEELILEEEGEEQLLLDVQIRPKVVFNVNSRSKKITGINEWQNQSNVNSIRHRKSANKVFEFSNPSAKEGGNKHWENSATKDVCDSNLSEKRKNKKSCQQRMDEDKEQNTKTSQTINSSSSQKDIVSDSIDQSRKSRGSGLKSSNKSLLASTVDANWKDKVINQFLKMSKNDICNMVNSSGLRKFDIAMKHLVKERKYSLSQERRSSADEAIKGYDMSREEFMSQLSAMLDPSATVDIKNLPSKFIQHLSEVLKLDVKSHLSDTRESWPEPSSAVIDNMDVNCNNGSYNDQNNFSENNDQQNFSGLLDSDNSSTHIKSEVQPTQTIHVSTDFSNLFANRQTNNDPISTRDNNNTLPNMTVIDDIFSAGIAKAKLVHDSVAKTVALTSPEREKNVAKISGQFFPLDIIRVRSFTNLKISGDNFYCDDVPLSRSEDDIAVEKTGEFSEEKSQEKGEHIERWNRRNRQDPDMFRNLTKEEWEAKYSKSADSLAEREPVLSREESSHRSKNSRRSMSLNDEKSNRNQSPPSHLREMNWNTNYVPGINDETRKWPKLNDYSLVMDSGTDKGSNCTSRLSDSDRSALTDVTTFLKVIKSPEKIAKNINDNQRIRNEVSAEIELIEQRDRELQREYKIRKDDKDMRSTESKDKRNRNNSSAESDHRIDEIGKEFFNREEMEYEKDEMSKNVANIRLSKSNSGLPGADETDKSNLQEQHQKEIEFCGHSQRLTNHEEIFVAQDYNISLEIEELTPKISPSKALLSTDNKVCEAFDNKKESEESEGSMLTQDHSESLELKKLKNTFSERSEMQLNKSAMKKIDIQAYKARKLQRNINKQDNITGEIARDSTAVDSESTIISCLPVASGDETSESKSECDQKNSSKNLVSTELIESHCEFESMNTESSSRQRSHKDENSVPKPNPDKKDERKLRNKTKLVKYQTSDKSREELHHEEKCDKKRSRNYSKDSHRSRSRDDNRRTPKEKSQRSYRETTTCYSKSENKPRLKSPHDNNQIFESKNKKPTKHRTSDIFKKTHQGIEKREKSQRTIPEDKPGHKKLPREHYDAKKTDHCDEPTPACHVSAKILTNTKTVEYSQDKDDITNGETSENLRPIIDLTNVERKNKEMLTDVTETRAELNLSQVTIDESTKSSFGNIQTLENEPLLSQAEAICDLTKSREADHFSHLNKQAVTRMDSENTFDLENLQKDAHQLSSENEHRSGQNETKDYFVTEDQVLELSKTHQEKSTRNPNLTDAKSNGLSHETTEKVKVLSKFNVDELELSSQSDENESKLIVEHLTRRVVTQLDSLNEENENENNIFIENNAEIRISSQAASEFRREEPPENTVLHLNSPATPESPLKGFSEETIKSSILGKRKLAQSVMKITEDYIQNNNFQDSDNTMVKIITESDTIRKNSVEITSYGKSNEIDALSVVDGRLETVHIDTEKFCNKSDRNERIVNEKIESIQKDNEKNPDTITAYEEQGVCARPVKPSGDTLSLSSSIDFDNSEFIVLSEISSDENFSQDEERKRATASILNTKQKNLDKAEGSAFQNDASQKDADIAALAIARDAKFKPNRSSREIDSLSGETVETNIKDLAKSSKANIFSHSSQSELESNQSQDHNMLCATDTNTASLYEDCKEQPVQETDYSSKATVDNGRVSSHCDSVQSDDLRVEKDNVEKIFSIETEVDGDKTKNVEKPVGRLESERTKNCNASSKTNLSSSGFNANKNMHRVKRTHRTKLKKNKKQKLNENKMKGSLKVKDMVTVVEKLRTKESATARMAEIDMEIQKLMSEKMKINQLLESDMLRNEKSLTGGKDDLSVLEKPDSRLPNTETSETTQLTKVNSETKLVSSESKTSKNISSKTSEDEMGNRGNGKEKERDKKKMSKCDRSLSQEKSIPDTESRSLSLHKTSTKKSADIKSSVTKKENSKKDNSSQSSKQQKEDSPSSTLPHEKHTPRTDEEVTLAKSTDQTTLNKSLSEPCQKSAKIDNHSRSLKKVNKVADSRDNTIRQSKNEGQHCEANDETKSINETGCGILNDASEKQLSGIHSDESNRESGYLEQKGDKKMSEGLISLGEIIEREKTTPRKRTRAVFRKRRKRALKCSSETNSRALSPSEEEMPLQLLYTKKFNQESKPLKTGQSSSGNNKTQISNTKRKRTRSTKVLEHLMEVINAVAQNKAGKYQNSNKVDVEFEGMVDTESKKLGRKEKILKKIKRDSTHSPDQSARCELEDVWPVADLSHGKRRSTCDKSLDRNDYRNNLTEFDDFNGDKSSVGSSRTKSFASVYKSEDKSSTDKIIEIFGESSGRSEIAYSSSKSKATSVGENVGQVSPFDDFYEENISDIFHSGSEKYNLSEQWNIAEDETFNYTGDIPQFLNNDSDLIPQDSMSRSNSTSCNFNMEKELDIFDLMLETVASDFKKTSKNFTISGVQKRGRKRVISGNRESERHLSVKHRVKMTRSEMMNCSVRLVDCKYTHLKNYRNSRARRMFNTSTIVSDKSTEYTYLQQCNGAHPTQIKYTTESYAPAVKSRGHSTSELKSSLEPNAALECPDWSFCKSQLIKDDKVVLPLSTELLTSRSDVSLNDIKGSTECVDNDLEFIKSQTLGRSQSLKKADDFSEKLTKASNSRYSDEMQTTSYTVPAKTLSNFFSSNQSQEQDEEVTVVLDSQEKNSLKCEVNTSAVRKQLTEYGLRAKPLSKLVDAEVLHLKANAKKIQNIKDRSEASERNATEEEEMEQYTGEEKPDDVQIINQLENREDNGTQDVELSRIQYSAHKGPILDLKVFGDSILAASEDGLIYRYSQTCNGILNTYEGHKSAVTCMYVLEVDSSGTMKNLLFSGSLDGSLRCYDIKTSMQVRSAADVGSSIQCMDQSWGVIFLGTKSGYVSRFHIKSNAFRGDEIKFSEEAVLGLKTTTEGPRRVLIVASRNQPITIRDAQSGLLIRTISGHKSHTVYSLLMDSNLVYCGTSSTAIPVFDFINGSEIKLYNAGPGVVCMRMYKKLLFAGCYDGYIYVFDTKEQKIVCSIPGPGNMLLSMDIVDNKIVAGSKDRRLHMWQMPEQVHKLLATRT